MFKTTCLDNNGNTVYSMTQYDIGQKLIIELPNLTLSSAPEIHFCNTLSVEANIVQSTMSNQIISAPIPTELLIQPHPILAYVYSVDNTDASCQKTIAFIKIPINKRKPPNDYDNSNDIILGYINDKTMEINDLVEKIEAFDLNTKISQMDTLIIQYNNMIASLDEAKMYLG